MSSYFSTPPAANVNTYIGGIPSSIVAADRGRELLQAYDNVYDTNTTTQQQITTLQNQMIDLRNQILSLQFAKSSQVIADAVNWIANGDCSQFTLPQPVVGTINAATNNSGFILNGRAVPIMDRWYHVAEGAGFNCSNLKMEAKQVPLTSYISGLPPYGTVPSSTSTGLSVKWYNPNNTNACFALETVNAARYGGMLAVQHIIPNARAIINTPAVLGFWIYSSKATSAYVRVLRQYNTTEKGGASLQPIHMESFNVSSGVWKYITMTISFGQLLAAKPLVDNQNGIVIQIGPCYYKWTSDLIIGAAKKTIYGSVEPFTSTTPGVEFVLSEIQLRTDVLSLDGTMFPLNLREDERTLKYVTYASPQKPSTMNLPNNSPVILSLGQMKNVDDYNQEYYFPMSFASRLVALPSIIIWGFKNSTVGGTVGIRWNNRTQVFNSVNACPDMWGSMLASALDINLLPYSLKKDASASNDVYYNLTKIDAMRTNGFCNARQGVQIPSMSESELIFRTRLSFSDFELTSFGTNALGSAVPGYVSLVTNRTVDMGWFTAIVAECDLGIYNNNGEVLSYVDYTVSAPTSLPL